MQAWTRLTHLVTDDPRVLPQVLSAVSDPAGYLAVHRDALDERGIEEADEVTAVVALVDALLEIGEVAYVDWKEAAHEVRAQLAALPRVRAVGGALDSLEGRPHEVAAAANALLAPAGVAIVGLDEDSDAYPLLAVPAHRVSTLVSAGAAVGGVVTTFGLTPAKKGGGKDRAPGNGSGPRSVSIVMTDTTTRVAVLVRSLRADSLNRKHRRDPP